MSAIRPTTGDRFHAVYERRTLTVRAIRLAVSEPDGSTVFLVEADDGAHWTVVPVELVTGEIRWLGTRIDS
jgi:hypothetical protein